MNSFSGLPPYESKPAFDEEIIAYTADRKPRYKQDAHSCLSNGYHYGIRTV